MPLEPSVAVDAGQQVVKSFNSLLIGIIRQMIHPVMGTGDIVVVAQELPCWLPVALAWGLPVTAVFVQARFHSLFAHLMEDKVVWGSL
jgi:hypothetical protein